MDNILTVNDVAAILKVKPITVREMFREERIRGFKVGKSWRTTEVMLQQDIQKLAHGEAPDKLPKGSNGAANHAVKPKKKSAVKTAKTETAPSATAAKSEGHEKKAAAPKREEAAQQKDDAEISQQLLF